MLAKKYIDANKIRYYLHASGDTAMEGNFVAFKSDIDKIPSEDVPEVVRCKDCTFFLPKDSACLREYQGRCYTDVHPNDFCSRGIPKEK